ncbi:UNVERIFIED_CONTAM: putative calcium-binding protein [Sesamum calycinum]|uniref:Calcium-binding protein n=1 Tax=Sesamum calycinum TaxID=2727403 RepID=A0AAW2RQY3_9LAMI
MHHEELEENPYKDQMEYPDEDIELIDGSVVDCGDPSYRESDVKGFWLNRNKRILDWLLCERASIICLQWVSHRNHRGNICGVDFIWLLNPNRYRKLLKTSWSEALAGMLKHQLKRVSLTEDDAFAFLKADSEGDYITYFGFYEALQQLNLVGHCHGLCNEEVKELWLQADVDRNGVIDYKEFKQQIWNTYSDQGERERDKVWDDIINGTVQTIGFSVKNAVLFPAEVEKGMWPEDYSLSDHARLTVVFSPVRMPCSRLT